MKVTYGKGFEVAPASLSVAGNVIPMTPAGEFILPSADQQEVRAWIMNLTRDMLAMPSEDKREFEVRHTFLNGMYMRELFIPKGSILIGKIHKMDCINIVSRGEISVMTETGSARVKAGYTVVSPAGIQKLGYAHEDTVFINVFRTDETDVTKIDDAIAFDSFEAAGYLPNKMEGELICQ